MTSVREERVLERARFDRKLPLYWFCSTLLGLTLSFVGIPIALVWLWFGMRVHRLQYERLECDLTARSLNVRKGFLFRAESNVPLDKITDVSLREGPILRRLGLSNLVVETAGQAAGTGTAVLTGVVGAPAFRDAILNQRDRVVASADVAVGPPPAALPPQGGPPLAADVLVEIRDALLRLEARLAERGQ